MISMKVEGGDDLVAALMSLSTRASRQILRDALMTVGEPMRRDIARKAPREPGAPDLADNIEIAPTRVGERNDVSVGIGVPRGFFYDWFLEFGTAFMSARAFYRPTFDAQVNRAINQLGATIWTELAGKGVHRPTVIQSGPVTSLGPMV